jgi:hypothetical protein
MASRALSAVEIGEASVVFGGALHYDRVRVSEDAGWPDSLDRLAASLKGTPPPAGHNAITVAHHSYFPVSLRTVGADIQAGVFTDMAWLIHELTHAWQYEHIGIVYLFRAIDVQIRLGRAAYDYGGAAGLHFAQVASPALSHFNVEQQGDIARDYYLRKSEGLDTTDWEPFVAQMRLPA